MYQEEYQMAFTPTATIKGSNRTYKVSETVKKYTLRDNGFEETKTGNFQFIRSLDDTIEDRRGLKLKIMIDKEMKQLKMSTTTKNGLQAVHLYGKENVAMAVEKLEFLIDGLVERGVLTEVSE